MSYGRIARLYRHPVAALILSSTFLLRGSSYLCLPFMTVLLFKDTHLSPYVIGAVVGLYQLGSVGAAMVSGILADRLGRRLILLTGLYGTSATYLAFFVLIRFYAGAQCFPAAFGLLNLGLGIAAAFYHPITQAILADNLDKEDRVLAFQHRYVLISVGALACPPLGAYLGVAAPGAAFLIVGTLHLAFSLFFTRLDLRIHGPVEPMRLGSTLAVLYHDRRFLLLTLSCFLFALATSQLDSNLSQIIASRFDNGMQFFSLVLSVNAITVFTLQPLLGSLSARWPPTRSIFVGMMLLPLSILAFQLVGASKAGFIALNMLTMISSMLVVPVASAVIDELAPPNLRSTYFGAASLRNLGQALGPAAGGTVVGLLGPGALFMFMALCGMAAAATILAVGAARHRRQPANS